MKNKLGLLIILMGGCYTISFAQNSQNVTFIDRYTEGPCFATASNDSLLFVGNGTRIDFLEPQPGGVLNKKSCFVSDYLVNHLDVIDNSLLAATDSGLYFINISNINSPLQVNFYPTRGNSESVFAKDGFAYLVDDKGWLYIFDLSNPEKPKLLSDFHPANVTSFTDVCVNDSLAFLCNPYGKLEVVNIKDKTQPFLFSSYDFENKYYPNTISIKNNYAFIGTAPTRTVSWLGVFFVLDISDPKALKKTFSSSIFGDWYSSGKDITIKDSLLFLAYTSDVMDGVDVYDISNPSTPKILNSAGTHGRNSIITGNSHGISSMGKNVFIADGGNGLLVYSIEDINKPKLLFTYKTGDNIRDVALDKNLIYSVGGKNSFNIFSFSNRSKITKIRQHLLNKVGNNTSIFLQNDYAYLTSTPHHGCGFQIINIHNIDSCYEVGCSSNPEGNKVVVKDEYAYVAARFYGLKVFRISDPSQPELLYQDPFAISAFDLDVKDNVCVLAADTSGTIVYDISIPSKPTVIVKIAIIDAALSVSRNDSVIFIAERRNGLRIINYKNPSINILIKQNLTFVTKVLVRDNYLYLLDDTQGLIIYDVTNPFSPTEVGFYRLRKACAYNIFVKDDLIFLSQGYYGFSVYKNDLITAITSRSNPSPANYWLSQNYPNPFNPATTIKFSIPVEVV